MLCRDPAERRQGVFGRVISSRADEVIEQAWIYCAAFGRYWHEAADHILICEGRFRGEADKQGRVASTAWAPAK